MPFLIFLLSCTLWCSVSPVLVGAVESRTVPQYSMLYEQMLRLEQEGKLLEALRIIPAIYRTEIPVDSFYFTLENKRRQLLDSIIQKEMPIPIGNSLLSCTELREMFTDYYLGQPDAYLQEIEISGDIDLARFYYFFIIQGRKNNSSASRLEVQEAVESADPWLVAGALFHARKQATKTVTPQVIIDRWQDRPDLWDAECSRQALYFLARLEAAQIKSIKITNEDIRSKVESLQPVPGEKAYIAPLPFLGAGAGFFYLDTFTGSIVAMQNQKDSAGTVRRRAGDRNYFSSSGPENITRIQAKKISGEPFEIEPGAYKLEFNSVTGYPPSGYYGESGVHQVPKGRLVVIPVSLLPAI